MRTSSRKINAEELSNEKNFWLQKKSWPFVSCWEFFGWKFFVRSHCIQLKAYFLLLIPIRPHLTRYFKPINGLSVSITVVPTVIQVIYWE
jgi:hypothetical protein